jgi:uncharacterized OB-fold protein
MPSQIPLVDYLRLEPQPVLIANECTSCGARFFGRRNACAACFGVGFQPVPVANDGEIAAYTVVTFGPPGVPTPYIAALITCDGTSVEANIINCPPEPASVSLGMKVRLATYSVGLDASGVEAVGFGYEPVA